MRKAVVIIGGGISGLAAAHWLKTHGRGLVDYQIVEGSPRLGGKIHSVHEDGFIVEAGPDSFLAAKPAVPALCRELGLQDQLIGTHSSGVHVWTGGRLVAMPEGLMMLAPAAIVPFLKSRLISWPGKLRMGLEALIPARAYDSDGLADESLAGFVRRRLGQEALDKIAGPLFAGIHSGDPEKLSLRSTFPLFADIERKHGSLLRGMLAQRAARKKTASPPSGGRSAFLSLRGGLQALVDAIAAQLPARNILLGDRAVNVARQERGFAVTLGSGRRLAANDILFTTPAWATADILDEIDPALAERLRGIRYVSTATVSLAFRRHDISHPLNGAGFLVASGEKRRITACTWSSMKFDHRAPEGFVLMRVFLGGDLAPGLAGLPEEDLIRIARQELRVTMQIEAKPVLAKAWRWPRSTPQYEVGHAARVNEIEGRIALYPGLHLAGAAFRGAGIPDCIENGIAAAKRILERVSPKESQAEAEASLCAAGMEAK